MGRRAPGRALALAAVAAVALAVGTGIVLANRGDDTVVRGGGAPFPVAAPGPTTIALPTTAPPEGVLAADQSGCAGIGAPPAGPEVTFVGVEVRAPGDVVVSLRAEDGRCLLRLATQEVRQLTWSADGGQVFLRRGQVWHRVGAGGDQTTVDDAEVPAGPDAYQAGPGPGRVQIPGGGATLEVQRDGALERAIVGHEGRSAVLVEGDASEGVNVVGSPYDPSALAWSYVKRGGEGCGERAARRMAQATAGGRSLALPGAPPEGWWPELWLPDGALVLAGVAPGCDAPPRPHWVVRDGRTSLLSSSAYAVAVRPGPVGR